jgi:hypothetical protein
MKDTTVYNKLEPDNWEEWEQNTLNTKHLCDYTEIDYGLAIEYIKKLLAANSYFFYTTKRKHTTNHTSEVTAGRHGKATTGRHSEATAAGRHNKQHLPTPRYPLCFS